MSPRQGLRVRVGGRDQVFAPDRVVIVGRSLDADVVLDDPLVSRMHARLRPGAQGWVVEDAGSVHGVWLGGRRVQSAPVPEEGASVHLGPPATGTRLDLAPVAARELSGVTTLPRTLTDTTGGSTTPALPQAAPAAAHPSATSPSDRLPPLRLRLDGRDYRFLPDRPVLVGRAEAGGGVDAGTDNPLVSRAHLRLTPSRPGWQLTDESLRGTFADGRPVRQLLVTAPMVLRLGDPVAGEELTLAPDLPPDVLARRARSRRRARAVPVAVLAAIALLAVVVGGGLWLRRDRDRDSEESGPVAAPVTAAPSSPAATESGPVRSLLQLEQASVLLSAEGDLPNGRRVQWTGSGSVLSADGLILTNAHVAAPAELGDARLFGEQRLPNPEFLTVGVVTSDADPARPTYQARVVAVDGGLDLAVLRVSAQADGSPLPAPPALSTVPVGDSARLAVGDDIRVLGFPGISDTESITVTKGSVASIVPDPDLRLDRGYIDTDARIAPGNSGGLAVNEAGELVGVPTLLRRDESGPVVSGRLRPIALALPLIDAAKAGQAYTPHRPRGELFR